MKKLISFILTPLLVLAILTTSFAISPDIIVSNKTIPASAVIKDSRVLVPLRAIFESLDATVDYDSASKTITGRQNDRLIILRINDKTASVNGKKVTLDVPASIIKGSTLVPVRFIGESLGADVVWANNTVLINSTMENAAISVINNFGENPSTDRNFTWLSSASHKSGVIEYCPKNEFKGFDNTNIIKTAAQTYSIKTDIDNRMVHKVALSRLKPGTEYIYRIISKPDIISPQGTFKTAETNLNQFTFVQITDTQGYDEKDYKLWNNTLKRAFGKFPDAKFLIHTGDLVENGDSINQWDLFANAVKLELMNIPIVPVVGNHDVLNENKTNSNTKNFTDRFNLAKKIETGAPLGTVYSFDYGSAHIAVMNTEAGSDNLKKQGEWLSSDMAKTNKPWKIVALHRGLYGAVHESSAVRDAWTPVFDKSGIDLVLQGHDHNYVRSFPMKDRAKVEAGKGTVYITANSGGAKFYPQKSRYWQAVDLQTETQMFVAVTVSDRNLTIKAYDVNNILIDTTTLVK